MEQVQRSKSGGSQQQEIQAAPGKTDTKEALKSELDELLDEIDEVLESNAEEFVSSYIQKGGE